MIQEQVKEVTDIPHVHSVHTVTTHYIWQALNLVKLNVMQTGRH